MYKNIGKKVIDKGMALLLIPVLCLCFMVFAIPQFIIYKSILFRQMRPGLGGNPFVLLKFQTMKDGEEQDEERLTKLGSFLRKTSLDELPQILNILKGEMSFVGPRPLLMSYLNIYSINHQKRHLVKPGITGWAQINGRNTITWEQRLNLDVEYVERQSFRFDLLIIGRTIQLIFTSAKGDVPMEKFEGYEK